MINGVNKMKRFMVFAGFLTLLLSACGARTTKTIDPLDVQASAAAAAATFISLTQAAIPTEAPTLEPSPTLVSPTQASFGFPTSVGLTDTPPSGVSDCHLPLDVGAAGRTHPIQIKNESSERVNLSLTLYKPNAFGQCGFLGFGNLNRSGGITTNLPSGYWSAYAWSTNTKNSFNVSGSFFVQPAQSVKLEICIRNTLILFKPAC